MVSCLAVVAVAGGAVCLSSCGGSAGEADETLEAAAEKSTEAAKPDAKTYATKRAAEKTADEKK